MYDVIIQARMGSKRLPGKSLMKYKNTSPLQVLINRIKKIMKKITLWENFSRLMEIKNG
mgnify:CR=1 FL=1